jgi:GNAT superfamily N-acetyltransferase
MSPAEVLALYDQTMRRDAAVPEAERVLAEPVVRLLEHADRRCTIVHAALVAGDVDEVVAREVAHFTDLGYRLEWKHYSHDLPADLPARLAARGFVPEEPETLLVLELARAPAGLLAPLAHEVRRYTDPDELAPLLPAFADQWDGEADRLGRRLLATLRDRPDQLSVHVAVVDGEPASIGWIDFSPGKPFSGLWGGSTRAPLRRRGLYTALVASRVREARARGVRYLTIDALPTSRPIALRHGFVELCVTTPYVLAAP